MLTKNTNSYDVEFWDQESHVDSNANSKAKHFCFHEIV